MGVFSFVRGLFGGNDEDHDHGMRSGADDRGGGDDVPGPERFLEDAEELAAFWPEHDLDFTPGSLVRLDAFVDDQWDKDRFRGFGEHDGDGVHVDELVFHGVSQELGSYFGETLVRNYENAAWEEDEEFGWVVVVAAEDGELLSNVFHVARDCLREPSKFAVTHDNVVAHAGVDAEPLDPDGDHVTIAVSMPDEDADLDEFRAAAEGLVADYAWADLDYSPASLAALDEVVTEEIFDGELLVDEFGEAELSETVRKLGSYLGETIAESLDGEWVYGDGSWTVDVAQDDAVVGIDVFRAALSTLHEDASFATVYDQFLDSVADEAGETTLSDAVAARAEAFAAEHAAYDLDFSRASLDRLDDLAAAEYDAFAELEEVTDDLVDTATEFGVYFGEVLRQEHDAVWSDDEDDLGIYVPIGDDEYAGVDAIQTAATCLAGNATFLDTCDSLLDHA